MESGVTTDTGIRTGGPEELRERMVQQLLARGAIVSPAVAAAFRAVPRHLFAPEVSAEEVYTAPEAIFTKRTTTGRVVSSVSASWLHARMLEAARLSPGMRVLEIGSGGCNAALLAEMVGPHGSVTSVDIDTEITDRARRLLEETGYGRVQVYQADGAQPLEGTPSGGWDRILVTAGSADLPAPWFDQLAAEGRLVVPLRFRSLSRTVAFAWEGEHLRSDALIVSGFLSMQGDSAHAPRVVRLADAEVRLLVDEDQPVEEEALRAAFATAGCEVWTGVELTGSEGLLPRLDVWLAGAVSPYGRLRATDAAAQRGLVGWVLGSGAGAVWSADSLAYLTLRHSVVDGKRFELGVIGHGPDREQLADGLVGAIRRWEETARSGGDPVMRAYRSRNAVQPAAKVTIEKRSAWLSVTSG
jgi:protein-L-isoaspartate(D-aspartate) O-methyltransferase